MAPPRHTCSGWFCPGNVSIASNCFLVGLMLGGGPQPPVGATHALGLGASWMGGCPITGSQILRPTSILLISEQLVPYNKNTSHSPDFLFQGSGLRRSWLWCPVTRLLLFGLHPCKLVTYSFRYLRCIPSKDAQIREAGLRLRMPGE